MIMISTPLQSFRGFSLAGFIGPAFAGVGGIALPNLRLVYPLLRQGSGKQGRLQALLPAELFDFTALFSILVVRRCGLASLRIASWS